LSKAQKKKRSFERRERTLRDYGISQNDVNKVREFQNNRCAICREIFTKQPHVDHSHVTGEFRGLTCKTCNFALGALKDDITILKRAIEYILNIVAPRALGIRKFGLPGKVNERKFHREQKRRTIVKKSKLPQEGQ